MTNFKKGVFNHLQNLKELSIKYLIDLFYKLYCLRTLYLKVRYGQNILLDSLFNLSFLSISFTDSKITSKILSKQINKIRPGIVFY